MIYWKDLSRDEKIAAIQNVAGIKHIPPQAVEKDLWVSTILQIVFTLPYANKLVFKGGTSLSKVFGKIQRFSEDIDLAVDRSLFGLEGDLTKKQLKKLRKASSVFVRDTFLNDLKAALVQHGLEMLYVEAEEDGEGDATYPEPRKIFIEYQSLFTDSLDYLRPRVMLEIGARSLIEPTMSAEIKSIVSECLGDVETALVNPSVATAVVEKTFLEKAFLLHELFSTNAGNHANRKSRHLYDLERMMDESFAKKALTDDGLWNAISHHRQLFTSMRDMDYSPDIRKRIVLLPPASFMDEWHRDYDAMRDAMIFGESLPFDKLIERIAILQKWFRNSVQG